MSQYHLWKAVIFSVAALQLFIFPLPVIAGSIEAVAHDFAPASGYIIAPVKGELLTDINAAKGVKIGDLLSVIKPGEAVIHPITGESLASLDEVLAVLRVTKVKSDYSYAVPLSGADYAIKGAAVSRFTGLKALFVDRQGGGEKLYAQLQTALPTLDWQGYYPADADQSKETLPATDLLFTFTATLLEARDSTGRLVHSYAVPPAAATVQSPSAPLIPAPPESGLKWEKTAVEMGSDVRYDNDESGYKLLGVLPTRTLMADFVATQNGLLLASTDGNSITVYQGQGDLPLVADYSPSSVESLHAVNWWQPAAAGPLYLTVSASVEAPSAYGTTAETKFKSSILELRENHLVLVANNLGYLLGSFDLDSDGRRETLFGQELDLDNFFGPIKQLQLKGGKITSTTPPLALSRQFPVQGSVVADLNVDRRADAAYVRNGMLFIEQDGKVVYQSRAEMGGSLSQLTYDKNPGQSDALFTSVTFEVSPLAIDLDADGQVELVVVSSDHPTFFSLGSNPDIQKSWLSVFKFKNGSYLKGSLAGVLNTPIQGIYGDKDQVILVTSSAASGQPISRVWSLQRQGD